MSQFQIALPLPIAPSKPTQNQFFKKFFAALSEGPILLAVISASLLNAAKEAYQKATNNIESNFKNFLKEPEKRRKTKIHIAETTRSAAKLVLEEEGFTPTEQQVKSTIRNIQNDVGHYSENVIIINLEVVKRGASGEQAQKEALVLTIIHETVEKYGGFPETHRGCSITWLDEGTTELIARDIFEKAYSRRPNPDAAAYVDYCALSSSMRELVGENTLYRAFFGGSPAPIFEKLSKCGIPESDILRLLELGEQLDSIYSLRFGKEYGATVSNSITLDMLSVVSRMKACANSFDWKNTPLETQAERSRAMESMVERMNLHLENVDSPNDTVKAGAQKCLFRLAADFALLKHMGKEGARYGGIDTSELRLSKGLGTPEEKAIDIFSKALFCLLDVQRASLKNAPAKGALPSEFYLSALVKNSMVDNMAREIAAELSGSGEPNLRTHPFTLVFERIYGKIGKEGLFKSFLDGSDVLLMRKLGRQGKAAGFGSEMGDECAFCSFAMLDSPPGQLQKTRNRLSLGGTWLSDKGARQFPNGSGLEFIFDVSRQFFPAMSIEERVQLSTAAFHYLAGRQVCSENDVYKIMSFLNACDDRVSRYYAQISLFSNILDTYSKSTGEELGKSETSRLFWLASDMIYRWSNAAKGDSGLYAKFPSIVDFVSDLEKQLSSSGEYVKYSHLVAEHWGDNSRLGTLKFFSYGLFSEAAVSSWAGRIPTWDRASKELSKIFPDASQSEISEFISVAKIYLGKNNYEGQPAPCRAVQLALSCKEALDGAMLAEAMDSAGNSIKRRKITLALPEFSKSIEGRFREVESSIDPKSLGDMQALVDTYLFKKDPPSVPSNIYSLKKGARLGQLINAVSVAAMGMECTIGESSCFLPYLPKY